MSGSPLSIGPSRKSRFRSQRAPEPRPASPSPAAASDPPADEPVVAEAEFEAGLDTETAVLPEREIYTYPEPVKPRRWVWPLLAFALLLAGGGTGYFAGTHWSPAAQRQNSAALNPGVIAKPVPLSPDEESQLDAAFRASKEGRFGDSIQLFKSFSVKHPQWTALPLELARFNIYQADYPSAQTILSNVLRRNDGAQAEAYFLVGFMNIRTKSYAEAEQGFALATAADPSKSEYYYLWGECLQQEGKPMEAVARFRSAQWRNEYETADDLIQLKIWLCEILLDEEGTDGAGAAIDAELALPHPRAAALLAAAARALKAGKVGEAARFIARGRATMDPTVYNIAMQDPTFALESGRPELAPFFRPENATLPPAVAPPASK